MGGVLVSQVMQNDAFVQHKGVGQATEQSQIRSFLAVKEIAGTSVFSDAHGDLKDLPRNHGHIVLTKKEGVVLAGGGDNKVFISEEVRVPGEGTAEDSSAQNIRPYDKGVFISTPSEI